MAHAGYGGSITLAGKTVGVRGITIDEEADVLDVTTFVNVGKMAVITGIKRWSGTLAAIWDSTDTVRVGDTGVLTAYLASGPVGTATGTIYVTGIGISSQYTDVVMAPITFHGTATLTLS